MAKCQLCGITSPGISKALGVCLICIRRQPRTALEIAAGAHRISRAEFGLPLVPPDDPDGIRCNLCVNSCKIGNGCIGYCGLRKNQDDRVTGASTTKAKLSWYHDPLPTNCVADWVCAAGTGAGYPTYAHCRGLNSDIRIWLFFPRPARLTAFFARTGILKEKLFHRRPEQLRIWFGMLIHRSPVLIANTLFVTGYIDAKEVAAIARFIASLNRNIPYSLLAFYHQFYLSDLPMTSRALADQCCQAARDAGLKNVHIGNVQLLT